MINVKIPAGTAYAGPRMSERYELAEAPIEAIPTLPTLMQGMAKALEDAHGALSSLEDRLSAVTRPPVSPGMPPSQKPEGMTMLAGGVYDAVESVSDLANRMRRITRAIDL